MPPARTADVIVAVDRVTPPTFHALRQILLVGDPALNRLIVVTALADEPELESLARSSSVVRLVRHADQSLGNEAWNSGMRLREKDCVLLAPGTMVTPGWLTELSAVAHSEERVAFACPLSNLISVDRPVETHDTCHAGIDECLASRAFSGLPAATSAAGVHGPCVYLRGPFIDAIGLLDPQLSTLQSAIEDWAMRAQTVGFFGKRANHAYVEHSRPGLNADDDGFLPMRDRAILEERHPYRAHQIAGFEHSLDGQLPRHAIELVRTGRLRVAFDIRHLDPGKKPERTDAINLAQSLAHAPEVDLWLLVNEPAQAAGFCAPLITPESWRDDFAVIHKPAGFIAREELAIPFGSSAHVVVTVEKWSFRGATAPAGRGAFPDAEATTGSLGLLCAQGILAHSQDIRDGIASELGISPAEIVLAPRGASADAVIPVYRSVVLNPSERSLQARRMLRDAILSWSQAAGGPVRLDAAHAVPEGPTAGVRQAWHALHTALQRRLGRQMRRLRPTITGKRT